MKYSLSTYYVLEFILYILGYSSDTGLGRKQNGKEIFEVTTMRVVVQFYTRVR
jgi:hypothetical protein